MTLNNLDKLLKRKNPRLYVKRTNASMGQIFVRHGDDETMNVVVGGRPISIAYHTDRMVCSIPGYEIPEQPWTQTMDYKYQLKHRTLSDIWKILKSQGLV